VYFLSLSKLSFEQALDKIAAAGASAVEIGTGGLPGGHHCNVMNCLRALKSGRRIARPSSRAGSS